MFQTEKLANLLDQLQNGRDLGYFATLSLILQIIGYFLIPILCIVLFFVTSNLIFNHFIPCILANRMAERNKKILQNAVDLDAVNSIFAEKCRQICNRILIARSFFEWIITLFFVSPFYFVDSEHDMIAYFAIITAGCIIMLRVFIPLWLLHLEEDNPVFASFWKYYKRNKL